MPIYSYQSDPIRETWKKPEPGDFGIEIEIDSENQNKIYTICHQENWAVERDGSLGPLGIEIVSPPMQYQLLSESILRVASQIRNLALAWNAEKYNKGRSYGIHISFHSGNMERAHLGRFIEFINFNPLGLCEFVAARKANHYSRLFPDKKGKSLKEVFSDDHLPPDEKKYGGVRLNKLPRVEVRLFRSTLNPQSIIANLEFVKSVIQFSQYECSNDPTEACEQFFKFLKGKRSFQHLKERMGKFKSKELGSPELKSLLPKSWS